MVEEAITYGGSEVIKVQKEGMSSFFRTMYRWYCA
ncbi:hypothetical protein PAEAM_30180 [Paenibacillus sp. GM1FR]|nr:hypothetical protein PAEAM_30180 [Paenibacillus sp. GM1FR]